MSKLNSGDSRSSERTSQAKQAIATAAHVERRRKRMWITSLIVVALFAAGLITVAALVSRPESVATGQLLVPPAADGTGMPPWPVPESPGKSIKSAGFTAGPMGTAAHFHAHLDILVNGAPVPVAADIGIMPDTGEMTPLHTHDTTGIVHIESPAKDSRFTLGQLFKQWDVKLTTDQIGGLTATSGNTLRAYVDGKLATGDPAAIELLPRQQVALIYGAANANPTIPKTYTFPDGL